MDDEEAMIFLSYILLKRRFHRKAERKAQKKEITLNETNLYRKGRKWYISYFSSGDGFRRSRVLFQMSIFMMILVILIYILGYAHNNYVCFSFKVHLHASRIFQVSVKCCKNIDNKKDTRFRKSISPVKLLCLTLHYLGYGCSQQSLSFSFQIAKSTINNVINKTCLAVWDCLKEQYVHPPRPTDD